MQQSFPIMLRRLISDSNTHSGFRVVIAMSFTFLPSLIGLQFSIFQLSNLQISISLCLGVMACAIVEVDENTKDRQKFIATVIACFFISSASTELLLPYPIIFAIGLGISSFAFMMLASLGMHYNRIGWGTILVAIYTMSGHQDHVGWFEQPLLLAIGAFWYGIFAISWAYFSPHRSLREHLSQLFYALSRYQFQKSDLFDANKGNSKESIIEIRQKLAILNIGVMARLQSAKNLIKEQFKISNKQNELKRLNQYYVTAEQIHERICASQYLYSQLEHTFGRSQILEGFHQLLLQISEDCHMVGASLNDRKSYQHSRRLKWTIHALSEQLYLLKQRLQLFDNNQEAMQALQAIYDNIYGINQLLYSLMEISDKTVIAVDNEAQQKLSFRKTILNACKERTPVFKHAVRISLSLVFAYIVQAQFQFENGFWILSTVLFVCQPSFSETKKKLMRRSIGTLAGIFISFPVLLLVHNDVLQAILVIFSAFFFFNYLRTNYGLAVVFITLFVMIVSDIQTSSGMEVLGSRISETIIGCLLSVLAISFIYPDWQFKRFPTLAHKLLVNSSRYFKQIAQQYQFGRSENMAFRQTRFEAFQSDAALTTAWQNMLFEPISKQHLKREMYGLVNRCDALNSYIAALSSHRHKVESEEDLNLIKQLFDFTAEQILFTYRPELKTESDLDISIDTFEKYKDIITGDSKLTVEQLRLIALTALDIQSLLQQIEITNQQN